MEDKMRLPDKTQGICDLCKKQEDLTQTHHGGMEQQLLCYDCCGTEGYCYGCGAFSEGQSDYDFSALGFYCGNCQEQIRDAYGENDEDYDDFEDDDDYESEDDDEYDSWKECGFE